MSAGIPFTLVDMVYERHEDGDLRDRRYCRHGERARRHCAANHICADCWEHRRPDAPAKEFRYGWPIDVQQGTGMWFNHETIWLCERCCVARRRLGGECRSPDEVSGGTHIYEPRLQCGPLRLVR